MLDRVRELRRVRAAELLAHPANWRRHPPAQRAALERVLGAVGFAGALLAREDDDGRLVLIDGHLRADTVPDLEVPVLVLDVTEAEAEVLLATYDPIGALADANAATLNELLETITARDADVAAWLPALIRDAVPAMADGPTPARQGRTDPDVAPDAPTVPTSRPGDLWMLGDHRVLCGDSAQRTVLPANGENTADVVFTDPPYGVSYQSRVDKQRRKPWGAIANDDLRGAALEQLLVAAIPRARARYVCADWSCYPTVVAALGPPKAVCVWIKQHFGLGKGYRRQHELVLFYGTLNRTDLADVWRIERALDYQHPTQKPVALAMKALADVDAATVYDPFCGAGSTVIAAELLGRRCHAIDIDPRYVDVTVRRWQDFTGRAALLDGGGTFEQVARARAAPATRTRRRKSQGTSTPRPASGRAARKKPLASGR